MDRLTYRDTDGAAMMAKRGGFKHGGVERLAAYEDTGYSPEEVKVMKWHIECLTSENARLAEKGLKLFAPDRYGELATAEAEGRLVVLEKHKIEEGRTVWALDLRRKIIYEGTVSYCDDFYSMHFDSPEWSFPFGNGHIGSYVFLSLEEAEAARDGGGRRE